MIPTAKVVNMLCSTSQFVTGKMIKKYVLNYEKLKMSTKLVKKQISDQIRICDFKVWVLITWICAMIT